MLSLKLRNRVDLLFAHAVRKDAESVHEPSYIATAIFEQIQPDSGSLYYVDVQKRVKTLATRMTYEPAVPQPLSFPASGEFGAKKGGRPRKWLLPLKRVYLPAEYHQALTEIALEWQENASAQSPF